MGKIILLMLAYFFVPLSSSAQEAWSWKIDPKASHIEWTATQNHAPVKGAFAAFTGEIRFHPLALAQSYAKIVIDASSITTSYDEALSTLKTKDWFAAEDFPQAVFESKTFEDLGSSRFAAVGTLRIKDKTVPVRLVFNVIQFGEHTAKITGDVQLKRTEYGLGWPETSEVADEVAVHIDVTANR